MSSLAYLCPVALPEMSGAVIHGLVDAASGSIAYLASPASITPELLQYILPFKPTEVLRFASVCAEDGCIHFMGSHCALIEKLVNTQRKRREPCANCSIRSGCRWHMEQGSEACSRCCEITPAMQQHTAKLKAPGLVECPLAPSA